MNRAGLERNRGRLSPKAYRFWLAAHIVVSVGWLGVVLGKLVLAVVAATTGSDEVAAALMLALGFVNFVFGPVAILTIVTGVVLSLGTKWGLLEHYWVLVKLGLTVGVIGTAVQVAPRLVGLPVADGTVLGMPWVASVVLAFTVTHLLMLGLAAVLSVYKPWGRISSGMVGSSKGDGSGVGGSPHPVRFSPSGRFSPRERGHDWSARASR